MGGAQIGLGEHHDDGSVFLNRAEIHLPHQAAENPRAVELRARVGRIEGKAGHRQSAAARQRLIDGGGEVAVEGGRRQQAGFGIEQAAGVDRAQRAAQMGLEGMLTDQRQGVGGNARGLAGYDFEIGQVIGRRQPIRRHHDRQIAKARILGQHGEEGIDHARAKTFAEHDAVDVARVEVFRGGFDRERADHAHPFAERYRKRRIGGAAADQQHGGVAGGIGVRQGCSLRRVVVKPAHHGGMQGPDPQRGAQARRQAIEIAAAWRERNGVFGQRCPGIDGDQRKIGLSCGDLFRQRLEAGFNGLGRRRDHNRGRLHLLDGARRVGPGGIDDRKHLRGVERCRKRRPVGIRNDNDRALLGHLGNSDRRDRLNAKS